MAETLVGWAGLALARQQPQRAATLSGAVAALLAVTHLPLDGFERTMHDNTIAALRAQLDEATFNAAWEAGRALTLEQAIEYALNE
ncbi:MAG: hypothetical protein HYR71_02570 [Chloroflexi bacterium]|nr:hypothetical protein [Chloroflexota bacterium]